MFIWKKAFYDVTSISSYSEEIIDVEYGYNRDGEHLAQFNIGMFCDKVSGLPIYYSKYNGSINDKANLNYIFKNAKSIGITDVDIIMDTEFCIPKSFKKLSTFCNTFIVRMPSQHKEIEKMRINNSHIAKNYNYFLSDCKTF
ncbi:MAG: hypothetical protein LBF12_05025 [Christensenellaceae bacterium]|nr:hypothetical protein [Christensenellaceae bacterium]